MKWMIILFLSLQSSFAFSNGDPVSKTTIVSGIVTDTESSEMLTGVRVSIVGTDIFTYSDRDGNFVLEQVPEGDIELSFQLVSFKSEVKTLHTSDIKNGPLVVNLTER